MPDNEITPEARLAVAAAFAYAGPMTGDEYQWKIRLQEGIARAGAAMNGLPAQDAQAMLDAYVFAGEYGGYVLEESSTRLLVRVKSDTGREKGKDAEGFERIRTDRTDSPLGSRMKARLDKVPIGSRIVVWKVLERMAKSEDDAKVRVLKHFEVIQINKDSASKRDSPPPSPPGEGDGAVRPLASSPTTTDSVAHSAEWSPVLERIRALEPGPLGQFVRQCQTEKLWWKNPKTTDDEDRILRILAEKEKL